MTLRSRPRVSSPELELEFRRDPAAGYERHMVAEQVRCLDHGFPSPLVRWHCHEEYELHLIVATRGKAYVGDYVGDFGPGHLVLTGPHLPHNWISTEVPEGGVALRDIVMQFSDQALRQAAGPLVELREVLPMLDRAASGLEFFGLSEVVQQSYYAIRQQRGLRRLCLFLDLLERLAACRETRQLSSARPEPVHEDAQADPMLQALDFIQENYLLDLSLPAVAARVDMTPSRFSRHFQRATGLSFSDYLNGLRVQRACHLLMTTAAPVGDVCYDAGFNNVANFNRRFRAAKGMTPKQFRREAEGRFGR
ncbi:AraC family transcriptional regulator [Aquabacterium sp. A7-Y]|uniref:AraC family transcriptional regulator n=1 Tax=Aquabacterium sp. A7-Y TaxID=1349605 RepID=UPI00223E6138|nr:AraC family transcriptional regulator [Aquabacterium sp. A7-Y]MCW7539720.1 AraC family transcriptional regulator [Aquabacterium sp. A7-Y]